MSMNALHNDRGDHEFVALDELKSLSAVSGGARFVPVCWNGITNNRIELRAASGGFVPQLGFAWASAVVEPPAGVPSNRLTTRRQS
jgi:hypothetical protein